MQRLSIRIPLAAVLAAAIAVAAAGHQRAGSKPAGAPKGDATRSAPAPKAESRTYDSLVAEAGRRRAERPWRPLVAESGGRLLAVWDRRAHSSADGARSWTARGALGATAVALGAGGGRWRCLLEDGRVVASADDGATWVAESDVVAAAALAGARVAAGGFDAAGGWAVVTSGEGLRAQSRLVVEEAGEWRRGGTVPAAATAAWRGGGRTVVLAAGEVFAADGAGEFARLAAPVGATLVALTFSGPERGLIASAEGLVLTTRDGGREWLSRPAAPGTPLDAVGAWTGDVAWALGRDADRDVLFVTGDGGVTWRRSVTAPAPLSTPLVAGGRLWLVDGRGRVWEAPTPAGPWRDAGGFSQKK